MHYTRLTQFFSLLLSVALLSACGDDDNSDSDANSGGNANANDGDDGDGLADDGGITPSVCDSDDATSSSVCVNNVDCEFIDTDGEAVTSPARDQAADCFFKGGCASDEDIEGCISQCMQDTLRMTANCSDCYAASVKCTAVNCLANCIDPSASQCLECQGENGCIATFLECSGLPFTE